MSEYPKRMTVENDGRKVLWVKDAGRKGAYQPMSVFFHNDEQATHTADECRAIRTAYTQSTKRVVLVSGIDGVVEVAPDWQQIMDAEFDFTQPSGIIGNSDSDFDVENYEVKKWAI